MSHHCVCTSPSASTLSTSGFAWSVLTTLSSKVTLPQSALGTLEMNTSRNIREAFDKGVLMSDLATLILKRLFQSGVMMSDGTAISWEVIDWLFHLLWSCIFLGCDLLCISQSYSIDGLDTYHVGRHFNSVSGCRGYRTGNSDAWSIGVEVNS